MSANTQFIVSGNAAQLYHSNMVPSIFRPFAEGLLSFAAPSAGEKILDAACGTGVLACLAAQEIGNAGHVVGLDLNAQMLSVARETPANEDLPIDWVEGDISRTKFADGEFDLVVCQQGLQYFSDRAGALVEMLRVLREKGRLVFSVWRPLAFNPGYMVFAQVLERLVSQEAGANRRAPFLFSDKEAIRELVSDAGFRSVQIILDVRVCCFASAEAMVQIMINGTPLEPLMKDVEPELMDQVISEVTDELADYVDDRGLAFPMQAWVVIARP
jgi:ubiquinone/menaquinone biosynthesis C-methylase UbiE